MGTRRCSTMAPVVIPVGVLAGDAAVVVDQPIHGVRQRDDLSAAVNPDPRAEEVVGEDAQGRGWVASKVADLVGRLRAADNHLPVAVDPDDDGRGLEAAWPRCCHKAPACWACPGGSATGSRLGPPAGAARSPPSSRRPNRYTAHLPGASAGVRWGTFKQEPPCALNGWSRSFACFAEG
jgi:hypothetical protein